MTTLAEIKTLLDKREAALKAQSELAPNATTGEISRQLAQVNYQLVHSAPDYLRALLPVVEAAKVVAETDSQYTRHSRDEIVALQKALKTLE